MTPPADDFPCNEFVELVTAFLDGALPEADARRLEEHLSICTGCTTVLEQFRAVIRSSGALAASDVDALVPTQRDPLMAAFREWAATRR